MPFPSDPTGLPSLNSHCRLKIATRAFYVERPILSAQVAKRSMIRGRSAATC